MASSSTTKKLGARVVQTGLRRGNTQVEYACWENGEKGGKTLVAIHCSGSSYKQYSRLAEKILLSSNENECSRIIAPNLHGSGSSSAWRSSRPMTLDDSALLVEEVLENEEIDAIDVLLGHSHGGSVATRLATRNGTERLILFEPNYLVLNPEPSIQVEKFFHSMIQTATADDFREWGHLFYDFWFSQNESDTWSRLDTDQQNRLLATTIPHTYHEVYSLLLARENQSNAADLKALEDGHVFARAHLILSATPGRGSSRPLRALAELLQARCSFSLSTLPVGGHLAPITDPDVFADHLLPLLAS